VKFVGVLGIDIVEHARDVKSWLPNFMGDFIVVEGYVA
jgi:hypothetical protein